MAGERPKGYIEWNPQPHVAEVVAQARRVLAEYAGYGPMTVRQIFYRLVGQYAYPKEERAYKRLGEYLVRARRAQMVSFDKIRDDGGTTRGGSAGWESLDGFLDDLADYSTSYELDRTLGQPYHLELWCEAEGMVPMLGQMVRDWNVAVTGTGGFSSVTVTHALARRIADRYRVDGKPTVLLHVGDFDPSGESIFVSMSQDVGNFVASMLGGFVYEQSGRAQDREEKDVFVPRRVALTEEQVAEYDLPSVPPKASDSRSARWGNEAVQAEAMPPDVLNDVVQAAVQEYVDEEQLGKVVAQEERELEVVGDRVRDAINDVREQLEEESDE